ncbi:MAG: FKBP-type peptidyl-prolyl cis-trans isomerase [Bacteroidota bacterium]
MFNKISTFAVSILFLAACNSNKVEVKDGLKFQFHDHDSNGKVAKMGDIMTFHLKLKNAKDSVLKDSYKEGAPVVAQVQKAQFKGAFEQGLLLLAKGDSATFFVPVDSLFKGYPTIPPVFTKGSDVRFSIKVIDIQTEAEFQASRQKNADKQKTTDATTIAAFVTKNKMTNVQKTESGLNYVITTPGNGPQVAAGDSITVKYTGKLSSGKVFESNTFPLQVGRGMVIPGWDEGLQKFKQGGKGTLLIPSGLGYGDQGNPTIPANSVLIFDVEILTVKKGK